MTDTAITPTTGSLAFTGSDAEFINSGDMVLVLTGFAPLVLIQPTAIPGAGSLTFAGFAPTRPIGIHFTSFAPSAEITHSKSPGTVSLGITGKIPQAVISNPPNITVAPETTSLGLSGQSITLNFSIFPATASLSITGSTAYASKAIVMPQNESGAPESNTPLGFIGKIPTPILSGTLPRIGTMIENANATPGDANAYNICDRTGFKVKPGRLVKDGYGHMVRKESVEPKNIQDLAKSHKAEQQKGALRPEPVGNEIFVEDAYPSGVTTDDL